MLRRAGPIAAILAAGLALAAPAGASERLEAGGASATVSAEPFEIEFEQNGGDPLVSKRGLEVVTGAGRQTAVRATSIARDGDAILAEVELDGGGSASVRVAPAGSGAFSLAIAAPQAARATAARFAADPRERFYGFGERSDLVERRGHEAENYVSDGPVRAEDREYTRPFVPPWAARDRDDSTYYPVPWLLSSRGWGVLVDEDVTSRLRPAVDGPGSWTAEADGASLRLRVFSGPTPALMRCAGSPRRPAVSPRRRHRGRSGPGSRPASRT